MTKSPWNPEQYHRFYQQRRQPFLDLRSLVQPQPQMRILDLGCGTGVLTRQLHDHLQAASTLGIDSSETMLVQSQNHTDDHVRFELQAIEQFTGEGPEGYDLVFSNAALQWIGDHTSLWKHVYSLVAPGGQLAIQIPANHDHASHRTAALVAQEEPFASALGGWFRIFPVLPVDAYALLLEGLGAVDIHVRLQVYIHPMPSREALVEWVKGSLLTAYERRMPESMFPDYLEAFRDRLFAEIDDTQPYIYPFKRILMWCRRPEVPTA
ncbi:MAG: methyltransferase domain-containing protein [Myxococcota bacterium]